MRKITLKKLTKGVNTYFNSFVFVLLFFMAGAGFFLGIYSTALWYMANMGVIPKFLFVILKIFDILMWMGVVFIGIKVFLWLVKIIDKFLKRGKK